MDLYAGTGSFGLECLSRGANGVFFVENSVEAIKILKKNVNNGMAIWGTCAGMIIISKNLTELDPKPIGLLDITVSRNWFGRQIDSFEKDIKIKGLKKPFRAVFIRAPIVKTVGKNIEILYTIENQYPVAVKTEKILATSFHPELTNDLRIHKIFLEMIKKDPK